jgi:hypothetical protein
MIKWRNIEGLPEALTKAGLECYQCDNMWIVSPDAKTVQAFIDAYEPHDSIKKRIGFEFEGVMCSATSQDQAGLTAVLLSIQVQGAKFRPTRFAFENGSTLVITLENYQAFMDAWVPFRQSFFAALRDDR